MVFNVRRVDSENIYLRVIGTSASHRVQMMELTDDCNEGVVCVECTSLLPLLGPLHLLFFARLIHTVLVNPALQCSSLRILGIFPGQEAGVKQAICQSILNHNLARVSQTTKQVFPHKLQKMFQLLILVDLLER